MATGSTHQKSISVQNDEFRKARRREAAFVAAWDRPAVEVRLTLLFTVI
jgi:hypothetical protein